MLDRFAVTVIFVSNKDILPMFFVRHDNSKNICMTSRPTAVLIIIRSPMSCVFKDEIREIIDESTHNIGWKDISGLNSN